MKEKTATTKESPVESPVDPARGTRSLAAIRDSGELRVAADPDAPPFLAKDKAGNYEGFEWAVASALADGLGAKAVIVPTKFGDIESTVAGGKADLAVGQVSPSPSYKALDWSVSYLQYSMCLVVPASSPITGMADLRGKRVGMYDDPVARQLTDVLVSASYERVLFDDYGYFEKMVRGQLDAMVYDCPLARHEMKTYGDQLKVVDDALNVVTYNVAVPAGATELRDHVNTSLQSLANNGLLATLEARWLGAASTAEDFETKTGKVVVVKKGDTLSLIAARALGSAERWKDIYAINKDVVGPDPNLVYTGMRLRLPR